MADEFGVGQTVRRDGDGWAVRFARSLPPEPGRAKGYLVFRPLRAGLALVRIVVGSLRWGLRATSEHGARRDNPAMKREVQ